MTWFKREDEPLSGLSVIQGKVFADNRGEFSRLYSLEEMARLTGLDTFRQVNRSMTRKIGSIRGMHFQCPPFAEVKLVRCIRGSVWDVAVDIRRDSATFLHWHAEQLSAKNNRLMVIPEGFAHGFQVLEDDSELIYFHSEEYQPTAEDGLRYDDPALAIDWPLPVTTVSERDRSFSLITQNYKGI